MAPRSGFSLIEALVVLAIGGMALAIIFSIGTKAGEAGFKLGRGAMAAADRDVAFTDLRTILSSLVLRPPATFLAEFDQPITGDETRLTADVVMRRATICGPQGWAGRLTLIVDSFEGGQSLSCAAGQARTTVLVMPRGSGRFRYSEDGVVWRSSYSNDPARFDAPNDVTRLQLFVRFEATADDIDIVEGVSSGPFERWIRNLGEL
jgi:prepilin-type N-terminal cleavage/methylation domain-containing protein